MNGNCNEEDLNALWWLILYINLTDHTHIKHCFWECMWGYFWDNISIGISELSRLSSPMWVGVILSITCLNRTKRGRKEEAFSFFLLCYVSWDISAHVLLYCPATGVYPTNSSGSQPCTLELNYTTGFPGPLLTKGRSWDFSVSIIMWANSS